MARFTERDTCQTSVRWAAAREGAVGAGFAADAAKHDKPKTRPLVTSDHVTKLRIHAAQEKVRMFLIESRSLPVW